MKKTLLLGFVAAVAVVGGAWRPAPAPAGAQGKLSKFRITIHTTATGFVAECTEGCAWTNQTVGCAKDAAACDGQITESGVGPVRTGQPTPR